MFRDLKNLQADPNVDVIVIARGGGDPQGMLMFSDEELVREVAACKLPVISAIGHEEDHPLLDDVADVRASTPTDVAKHLVPD
jgi:exodeoxyribonuclease VII large subunit